jgi:hypothetical protein
VPHHYRELEVRHALVTLNSYLVEPCLKLAYLPTVGVRSKMEVN